MQTIQIESITIGLGQFLKWAAIVGTGGEVKMMLETEEVLVNGEVETRRGRKLIAGDVITLPGGEQFIVEAPPCS